MKKQKHTVPFNSRVIPKTPHTPEYLENTKPSDIPDTIHNLEKKKSLRKGK